MKYIIELTEQEYLHLEDEIDTFTGRVDSGSVQCRLLNDLRNLYNKAAYEREGSGKNDPS